MYSSGIKLSMPFTVIGAIVTVILQVVLAQNIAIFDVAPNFILIFVVINAMFSNEIRASAVGFALGLVYDILTWGILGVMSLILSLMAFGVSSLNKDLFSSGWVFSAFLLLVSALLSGLLYAAMLSILGHDSDFLMSLGMRVIPSTIYSSVFGLIVFPILSHISEKKQHMSPKGKLR